MKTLSERVPVLSKNEREVLNALTKAPGRRSMRQLAQAIDLATVGVRKAIVRLVGLDFVEVVRLPTECPVETYRITKDGREFLEEGIVREKPDSAAAYLWSRLGEAEQAVLRVIGQDKHDVLVTMGAIAAQTSFTQPQRRLALKRLRDLGLIAYGFIHPCGPVGDTITAKGRRVLAHDYMNLVMGEPFQDRPSIAGHPLPWSIVPHVEPPKRRPKRDEDEDDRSPAAFIVDADGYRVHRFDVDGSEGKLWTAVVEHLSRTQSKPEAVKLHLDGLTVNFEDLTGMLAVKGAFSQARASRS